MKEELRDFLEEKYRQYNRPAFIEDDPVSIPHRFSKKEDIEIAGFLTALIAWGKRELIIRSANRMMAYMDESPFDFVSDAGKDDLRMLEGFVHRTMNGTDLRHIILGLRRLYDEHGGMEQVMTDALAADESTLTAIMRLRKIIGNSDEFPERTFKHLANPAKGASAKRLNMFLRWMVRRDSGGVDFGLWQQADAGKLICPLDVHTGNVARKLGLLDRRQNDWKSALALTARLREMDPADPVKYDFALFGLGIYEHF